MHNEQHTCENIRSIGIDALRQLESMAEARNKDKGGKKRGKCMCACGAGYWAQK